MKDLFNELFNELFTLIPKASELEGFDIKTETTPNGFVFTATKKPVEKEDNSKLVKFVSDFKTYVQNTDDAIFEKACAKYDERAIMSLSDLAKMSEEADMKNEKLIIAYSNLFKDCVKEAVTDFIVELQDKHQLCK